MELTLRVLRNLPWVRWSRAVFGRRNPVCTVALDEVHLILLDGLRKLCVSDEALLEIAHVGDDQELPEEAVKDSDWYFWMLTRLNRLADFSEIYSSPLLLTLFHFEIFEKVVDCRDCLGAQHLLLRSFVIATPVHVHIRIPQ